MIRNGDGQSVEHTDEQTNKIMDKHTVTMTTIYFPLFNPVQRGMKMEGYKKFTLRSVCNSKSSPTIAFYIKSATFGCNFQVSSVTSASPKSTVAPIISTSISLSIFAIISVLSTSVSSIFTNLLPSSIWDEFNTIQIYCTLDLAFREIPLQFPIPSVIPISPSSSSPSWFSSSSFVRSWPSRRPSTSDYFSYKARSRNFFKNTKTSYLVYYPSWAFITQNHQMVYNLEEKI